MESSVFVFRAAPRRAAYCGVSFQTAFFGQQLRVFAIGLRALLRGLAQFDVGARTFGGRAAFDFGRQQALELSAIGRGACERGVGADALFGLHCRFGLCEPSIALGFDCLFLGPGALDEGLLGFAVDPHANRQRRWPWPLLRAARSLPLSRPDSPRNSGPATGCRRPEQ
jgi:hypothetical protein